MKHLFHLLALLLLVQACDDNGTSNVPIQNPTFSAELSLGKITVFNDVCYSFDASRVVAVGYRDSLGDGNKQSIIAIYARNQLRHLYIDHAPGIRDVSLVNYDSYSRTFIAASEGQVSAHTMYRISTRDSSLTSFNIGLQGDTIHPTEIVPAENGNIALSGWLVDGGIEKGFLAVIGLDNSIQWARYYSAPGKNVRCENVVRDNWGFMLAVTESIAGNPGVFERSYLQSVSSSGTDGEKIRIEVPEFRVRDLVFVEDTGYAIVGELIHEPRTGYIGMVNKRGVELWRASLGNDSLFIPFGIYGSASSTWILNYFAGNENEVGMTGSINYVGRANQNINLDLSPSRLALYYMSFRTIPEQSMESILGAIKNFSRDANGNLIQATAAFYY